MNPNSILIANIISELKNSFNENLVAVFRIGSAESKYFCAKISDIDLFVVLKKLDVNCLKELSKKRQDFLKQTGLPLGFKVHTKEEFLQTMKGKLQTRFLNDFTLYRIQKGIWKEKYILNNKLMDFSISKNNAQRAAYLNLLSRINNARVNIVEQDYEFHCGLRDKNNIDMLHWAVSRTFDIFWYTESINGNILNSKWELEKMRNLNEKQIKTLTELYSTRQEFKFNKELLDSATNLTEERLEITINGMKND
jgi:predicted nucleotidyltransferase